MNFCILHQHLHQADGFQIPPQTQMLQRCRHPFDISLMTKFLSDRPNSIKSVLKGWGIFIAICILLLLLLTLVFNYKLKDTSYFVFIILFIIQVGRDLLADRLYEIRFDESERQICLFYKSWFFNDRQKSLSFDTTNLVVTTTKTGFFGHKNSKAIHFLNDKTKLLEVNTDKDGFSRDTLENICTTAKRNSIRLSHV